MKSPLNPPSLAWQDGVPRATQYDDVYYSAQDGLAEARHVFLQGNDLATRIAACTAPWFRIGETGFGTGLNLLALWQMWDALPTPKPRLHFVTVDLHPMQAEEMTQAHAAWPELHAYSRALCEVVPPAFPGAHRRLLAQGRIIVDFLWGEAAACLGGYAWAEGEARMDAWFLDGFSPAKNPAMWQPELYAAMARLSGAGTRCATFTAAGHVRRGLIEAGFAMQRAPGFGHKREMLAGCFQTASPAAIGPAIAASMPALVIGAGLAGVGAAWRLAGQGRAVVLLEAGTDLCTGASGNPAAACLPYFTSDWSLRGRLYASGFLHMQHLWRRLEARGHAVGKHCGAIALALDEATILRQKRKLATLGLPAGMARWTDRSEARDLAGIEVPGGGIFYPDAGWIRMRDLCRALLAEAGTAVELRAQSSVETLRHEAGLWSVRLAGGETLRSDLMVLANGPEAVRLLPQLGIEPVRGQLLRFAPPPALAGLRVLLNMKQTLMPAIDGRMLLGSTYAHGASDTLPREEDTARLLNDLRRLFPALGDTPIITEPWVGVRAAQAQRQPLVGPALGQPAGLYLHLAHGSRGTLSGLQPLATASF